jgi:Putative amidase domain
VSDPFVCTHNSSHLCQNFEYDELADVKTWNRANAASYADTYEQYGNTAWRYYNGDDCTNFVSQSLYAGGLYMVGTGEPAQYQDDSQWWEDPVYLPIADSWTLSWTVAANNYNHWTRYENSGPNVYSYYGDGRGTQVSNTQHFQVADLVYYSWNGDGKINHMSIVTAFGASLDNSGLSGPLVDSHTNPEYHVYFTLAAENPNWMTTLISVVHINDDRGF